MATLVKCPECGASGIKCHVKHRYFRHCGILHLISRNISTQGGMTTNEWHEGRGHKITSKLQKPVLEKDAKLILTETEKIEKRLEERDAQKNNPINNSIIVPVKLFQKKKSVEQEDELVPEDLTFGSEKDGES